MIRHMSGAARGPRAGARAGFLVPTGEVADALQGLVQVTAELAAADDIDAVVQAAVGHAGEAVGAAVTTLMLRTDDELVLVGGRGLQPGVFQQWASFKLTEPTPASDAANTGRPVAIARREDLESRYPRLRGQGPAGRSTLCLPLGAPPANVGVLGLTFEEQWLPGAGEMAFLMPFADACAQALRRLNAAHAAEVRQRQLRFLADVSLELGRSLDYRATMQRVAELVVPDLADWCTVQILEDGNLTTLAVAHTDPAKVRWAWQLQKRFPTRQDAPTGAPAVVRSGVSELYAEITDDLLLAGARDDEELQQLRELSMRSVLIAPLTARERTFGAITMIRTNEQAGPYGPEDLQIAEDLGRRAGLAIDNSRLHSQTRDVALQLQQAVLPRLPASLPGWKVAGLYEPGERAEVGGDFFDALPLPDGQLVVVVGDVMGHGIQAAATMAQVRAAIRGFATIDPQPQRLLERLQTMFAELHLTSLVSVVYALADRSANTVEIANAGAMPPLLVRPGEPPEYLPIPPRAMLGAGADTAASTVFPLPPEATLLLFTDGLVERRGVDIDAGLDRLRGHARELDGDLDLALRTLAARLRDPDGHDDLTALAIRSTAEPFPPDSGGAPWPTLS